MNEEFNSQNNGHVNLNKSSPEYANNQNNGAVNSFNQPFVGNQDINRPNENINMYNVPNPNMQSYQGTNYAPENDVVSIGMWFLLILASLFPFVNIIIYVVVVVCARNKNLQNYCKAMLIYAAICMVLMLLWVFVMFGIFASMQIPDQM